jgi:predicted heme/steroid binding protein
MTRAELAGYDGRGGRRAYIAVNGTIYDVTDSPHWQGGLHPPDHQAGQDLTEELLKAPHVRAVVERYPVVGSLTQDSPSRASGGNTKIIFAIIVAIVIALVLFLVI